MFRRAWTWSDCGNSSWTQQPSNSWWIEDGNECKWQCSHPIRGGSHRWNNEWQWQQENRRNNEWQWQREGWEDKSFWTPGNGNEVASEGNGNEVVSEVVATSSQKNADERVDLFWSKEKKTPEQITGHQLDPDKIFFYLENYERTLPHDTFTRQDDDSLLQPAPRSRIYVRDDGNDSKRVCMRLHTGSPVRREFSAGLDEDSQEQAELLCGAHALRALSDAKEIEFRDGAVHVVRRRAQEVKVKASLSRTGRSLEEASCKYVELARWTPGMMLQAHVVRVSCDLAFAFIGDMQTNFNYKLFVRDFVTSTVGSDETICLEVNTMLWNRDCDEHLIREFHTVLMGREEECIHLACVCVSGDVAAFEPNMNQIQECVNGFVLPSGSPNWLPALYYHVRRLRLLEDQLIRYGPAQPPVNPLKMEAIMGSGQLLVRELLALAGDAVLREMASLAVYVVNPFWNANRMEDEIKDAINSDRCGKLLVDTTFGQALLDACAAHVSSPDDALKMFQSLMGALFIDSGPCALSDVWALLSQAIDLKPALKHMRTNSFLRDHTDTYHELWELKGSQIKRMKDFETCDNLDQLINDSDIYLHVAYSLTDSALYRRGFKCDEELRFSIPEHAQWMPVIWDTNVDALRSSSRIGALPNKIAAWLRAQTLMSQATIKTKKGFKVTPLTISKLRQIKSDKLQVVYSYGTFETYVYTRSGGIPMEVDVDGQERVIGYSESEKKLLSPAKRLPLPNMIAEWICGVKDLTQVLRTALRRSCTDAGLQMTFDSTRNIFECTDGDLRYLCCAEFENGHYILKGAVPDEISGNVPWEELWFLLTEQQWATSDNVVISARAVRAMFEHIDEANRIDFIHERITQSPWVKLDSDDIKCQFTELLPKNSDIEKILDHTFANPMLLVQALTHSSAPPSISQSNERLAVVGEAVLKSYVVVKSIHERMFATASGKCGAEFRPRCSFVVAKELKDFKDCADRPGELNDYDQSIIENRMLACCNHSSYACSCVRIRLHDYLRHNSEALLASIDIFLQLCASDDGMDNRAPSCGAPRALGDVFLACIGALILDGAREKAEKVIEKHMEECRSYDLQGVLKSSATFEDIECMECKQQAISMDEFGRANEKVVNHARSAIEKNVLAPLQSMSWSKDQLRSKLIENRDVHVVDEPGVGLFGGVSPRSAFIHRGRWPHPDVNCHVSSYAKSKGSRGMSKGSVQSSESGSKFFCEDCERYFNGPIQLLSHRAGKDHKNKIREICRSKAVAISE